MHTDKRLSTLALTLILVASLGNACAGGSAPKPDDQQPGSTVQLAHVTMNPQAPTQPPFSGLGLPSKLSASLGPQTLPGRRVASFTWDQQNRDAAAYANTVPAVQVQPDLADPLALDFNPAWTPGNGINGAAYSLYEYSLPDYDSGGGEQTLGVNWLVPAVQKLAWVGLGNFSGDRWDWFEAPDDGVLTLDSYLPYIETPSGRILVAVVVLGADQAVLRSLHVGQQETRGMGDQRPLTDILVSWPPIVNWPILSDKVDLSPGCSPINDQGQTGSCTAFANADGAFNYELKKTYGSLGWDFSDPFNRCSPRYVYNQTGVDLGGDVPLGSRSCGAVGDWLLTHGTATEKNAPTGSTAVPGYNTGHAWSSDALADAALLMPATKNFIGQYADGDYWWDDADIDKAEHVLKDLRHVICFRVDVDKPFCYNNLSSNKVWNYVGPDYGGHAMVIVGYDTGKDGGKGAFKVRNSWGTGWGTNGYCWIGFDTFKNFDAGIYGYYFTENCTGPVSSRFLGTGDFNYPCMLIVSTTFIDKVALSWEGVSGATGYLLYRDNQDTPFMQLPQDVLSFDDMGVSDTNAHVYWVKAMTALGTSDFSPAAVGWLVPAV